MGVTQLWQILGPVEQHQPLASLEGLTLAVDLSIWVCETQAVKQMQGTVSKPFLRNLFFRICHLTQLGVKLVFVIEGSAPELKWEVMLKRQQSRFPGRQGKQFSNQKPAGKQTRRNFNACLRECCELLEILGIPYVQSKGEAEAMCALLNAAELVDGCLTNDGDAFLYGAKTVYRNFTMNSKDPHVEMYRMSDIESQLGIDRSGLVGLGLLLGCDFVPKGVPGIGVANALKLMQSLQGKDVLKRIKDWRRLTESECVNQVEILARRKAISVPDFPQTKVISEFLEVKDRCPTRLSPWKRPVPDKLQEFALVKLEWPMVYTLEKVLPMVTLWDMQDLLHSKTPSIHQHLKPHKIVKSRIRQGIPCYEVEWIKPVTETSHEGEFYITIEIQDLFTKCHPDVVSMYETVTLEMKKKKKPSKAKKKKKTEEDAANEVISLNNLSFNFDKMNINLVKDKIHNSIKDLHPSFTEYDENLLMTKLRQPKHNVYHQPAAATSEDYTAISLITKPQIDLNLKAENVSNSGPGKHITDNNLTCALEDEYVPLSQRVKMRLKKKQQQNNESEIQKLGPNEKNVISNGHVISNGAIDMTVTSSGKKKKKKAKSKHKSDEKSSATVDDRIKHLSSTPCTCTHTTKHSYGKHDVNDKTSDLSNMDTLLDDVEQLSLYKKQYNKVYRECETGSESTKHGSKCNKDAKLGVVKTFEHRPVTSPSVCRGTSQVFNNSTAETPFSLSRMSTTAATSRKMSSPLIADDFCSPMTYIKQSFEEDGNKNYEMKNSPILCKENGDMGTCASYQFKENPAIKTEHDKKGKLFKVKKQLTNGFEDQHYDEDAAETKNSHTNKGSLKSCQLKGMWVTEKVSEIVTENGEKFSFGLNHGINGNKSTPKTSCLQTCSTPDFQENDIKFCASMTPAMQRNNPKMSATPGQFSDMDISSLSQFGDFQVQHSLLNSLCGSLMHALTPKGMPLEEYENLRTSLEKIQSEQNSVLAGFYNKANDDVGSVDFTEVEKASSKLKAPLNGDVSNLKPITLNHSGLDTTCTSQEGNIRVKMTKTAKKKLRKQQKLMRESLNSSNNKENTSTFKAEKVSKMSNDQQNKSKSASSDLHKQNGDIFNQSNNHQNVSSSNISISSQPITGSQKKSKRQKKSKKASNVTTGNEQQSKCDSILLENYKMAEERYNTKQHKEENACDNESFASVTLNDTGKKKSKNKKRKHKDKDKIDEVAKTSETSEKALISKVIPELNSGKASEIEAQNMCTSEENDEKKKKKKKRKKKKLKKASPLIDFSADETFFVESQTRVCADYLKKALESKSDSSRPPSQRIEKASPVMDISADDTLLELDALSTVITDSQFDSKTREKLKVAYHKTLIKQRSKTEGKEKTVEPVLSLNDCFQNKNQEKKVATKEGSFGDHEVGDIVENGYHKLAITKRGHLNETCLESKTCNCKRISDIYNSINVDSCGTEVQKFEKLQNDGFLGHLYTNGKLGLTHHLQNTVLEHEAIDKNDDDDDTDEEYVSCDDSDVFSSSPLELFPSGRQDAFNEENSNDSGNTQMNVLEDHREVTKTEQTIQRSNDTPKTCLNESPEQNVATVAVTNIIYEEEELDRNSKKMVNCTTNVNFEGVDDFENCTEDCTNGFTNGHNNVGASKDNNTTAVGRSGTSNGFHDPNIIIHTDSGDEESEEELDEDHEPTSFCKNDKLNRLSERETGLGNDDTENGLSNFTADGTPVHFSDSQNDSAISKSLVGVSNGVTTDCTKHFTGNLTKHAEVGENKILRSVLDKNYRQETSSAAREHVASPVSLADRLKLKLRKSTRSVLDSFTGGK